MSSTGKTNYYEVLGVEPTATITDIKHRYRELARKYHPDLNPGQEAAQKIKAVNEAYHVLGDEDKRAVYDFEQAKVAQATKAAHEANKQTVKPSPTGHATAGRVEFNGFGTVPKNPAASNTRPSVNRAVVEKFMHEAQIAFIARRFTEAERLCRHALSLDSRLPSAHEMMGDIYARRNHTDMAVKAYTYALQYNPHNAAAMAKMQRLSAVGNAAQGGTVPNVRRAQNPGGETMLTTMAPDKLMLTIGVASVILLTGVSALISFAPGPALLLGFSLMLPVYLIIMGGLAGLLMALYGGLGPQAEELVAVRPNGHPVFLTPVLIISAIISYYISLIVYFGIGFTQGKFSRSVFKLYGAAMLLTLVCWPLYHPPGISGAITVPLLAGNILFPGLMAGWRFGDWLRMGSSLTKPH